MVGEKVYCSMREGVRRGSGGRESKHEKRVVKA